MTIRSRNADNKIAGSALNDYFCRIVGRLPSPRRRRTTSPGLKNARLARQPAAAPWWRAASRKARRRPLRSAAGCAEIAVRAAPAAPPRRRAANSPNGSRQAPPLGCGQRGNRRPCGGPQPPPGGGLQTRRTARGRPLRSAAGSAEIAVRAAARSRPPAEGCKLAERLAAGPSARLRAARKSPSVRRPPPAKTRSA